jgi:hypothetical protein
MRKIVEEALETEVAEAGDRGYYESRDGAPRLLPERVSTRPGGRLPGRDRRQPAESHGGEPGDGAAVARVRGLRGSGFQ